MQDSLEDQISLQNGYGSRETMVNCRVESLWTQWFFCPWDGCEPLKFQSGTEGLEDSWRVNGIQFILEGKRGGSLLSAVTSELCLLRKKWRPATSSSLGFFICELGIKPLQGSIHPSGNPSLEMPSQAYPKLLLLCNSKSSQANDIQPHLLKSSKLW